MKKIKSRYVFLMAVIAVIFSLMVCKYIDQSVNGTNVIISVEEFNNTPNKCSELYFFIEKKRVPRGKLLHAYKYRVSFWDNMFSPTKYLSKHPEDIAISTNAGDATTQITILTDRQFGNIDLLDGHK